MNNVFNLAEFRAKRQLPPPVARPVTKEDIALGVIAAFHNLLAAIPGVSRQSAVNLLAAHGARAIVRQLKLDGCSVGAYSRFQFFGVKEKEEFFLLGRVNGVNSLVSLDSRSEMFLIDATSLCAINISPDSNIAKNNTFCTLITLPMSDFYTL